MSTDILVERHNERDAFGGCCSRAVSFIKSNVGAKVKEKRHLNNQFMLLLASAKTRCFFFLEDSAHFTLYLLKVYLKPTFKI